VATEILNKFQEFFEIIENVLFRPSPSSQIPQELGQLKQLLENIRSVGDVEYGYKEIIEILHFISS